MRAVLSLLLLGAAAVMDIRSSKISNRLILGGWAAGLAMQVARLGLPGVGVFIRNASVPVILFYLLFLMRALGAGDIKLFSVIGGIWDLRMLFATILASFFVAAGMSLAKMLYHGNLISRLCVFASYARQTFVNGRLSKYPIGPEGKQHIIHFSIAILIGFGITLGVFY